MNKMKKIQDFHKHFAMFMLFCLTIASCEKPMIPDGYNVSPDGNLIVSVATIEQMPFPGFTTRTTIDEACTRLSFVVYDSLGTRVAYQNQKSDEESFGTAGFRVSPGRYQVVVVGHGADGNPTTTNASKIQFTKATGFADTFLSNTSDVVVKDSTENVKANLNRIVSLCRVVISDTIPADVSKMHFEYKGGSGSFDASTGLGVPVKNSKQEMTFPVEPGSASTVLDLYTFLPEDAESIHVKAEALDENDNLLLSREFDVPMKYRQITKLSGSFFTGFSGSAISIIIDLNADWDGEEEIKY